uniref:Uncharacterized protein n=1 Tax=Oryza rufipogon TaxID=4529 RepID=A0A0E0QX36_ORYRU
MAFLNDDRVPSAVAGGLVHQCMCCRGGEVPRWLGSHGVVGQGPATEALAAAATRWSWSRQTSDAAVGAFAAAVARWSWSCRRRQLGR